MAGRAQAFSDDTVIALTGQHFIPVAENCSPLQRQKDAKGDFFRLVAEQGHYAGRTYPTGTRQGYYALTADGTVLAAANSRDPQRMTELLQTALRRWSLLTGDGAAEPRGQTPAAYEPANPDRYPADGLVLRGRRLFVVENEADRIAEIRLSGRLDSGRVVATYTDDDAATPTTATFALGALYAVNARFADIEAGADPAELDYQIIRIDVR